MNDKVFKEFYPKRLDHLNQIKNDTKKRTITDNQIEFGLNEVELFLREQVDWEEHPNAEIFTTVVACIRSGLTYNDDEFMKEFYPKNYCPNTWDYWQNF